MAKTNKEKKVIINKEESSETPVKKKVAHKDYTLEIEINDSNFEAKGESLKDCFVDIIGRSDFPFAPKTRVFIKYGKGDVVNTKIMNVVMARRIFSIMEHKESAIEIFTNKLQEYLNE